MNDTTIDTMALDEAREVALLVTQIVSAKKSRQEAGIDRPLWDALEESGITDLLRPADLGGGGAGWPEAAAALSALGASAARVPLAEHDVIGGWLLREAGLDDGAAGIRSVGLARRGLARAVPWARDVDSIVVLSDSGANATETWHVTEIPVSETTVKTGENLAGEARDDVVIDMTKKGKTAPVSAEVKQEYVNRLSLTRSLMMAGASDRILELVMEHASTRRQFGRPLSAFQAVQHMVAEIAAEASLIRAAVDAALILTNGGGLGRPEAQFAVAAAASCAGHASSVIVRNAHQVMGAMGYTLEHELHHYTNRMLAWRSEAGSIRGWDNQILEAVAVGGGHNAWTFIADRDRGRS